MCHEISPPQIYTTNHTRTNENASSPTRDVVSYVRLCTKQYNSEVFIAVS